MSFHSTINSRKHRDILLVGRRNIVFNAAEGILTFVRPKATGYLGMQFCHADISFCQVVIKENLRILHKEQYLAFVQFESFNQILCVALFLAASAIIFSYSFLVNRVYQVC